MCAQSSPLEEVSSGAPRWPGGPSSVAMVSKSGETGDARGRLADDAAMRSMVSSPRCPTGSSRSRRPHRQQSWGASHPRRSQGPDGPRLEFRCCCYQSSRAPLYAGAKIKVFATPSPLRGWEKVRECSATQILRRTFRAALFFVVCLPCLRAVGPDDAHTTESPEKLRLFCPCLFHFWVLYCNGVHD